MKYKEYKELMKTPFEELSEEEQKKRKKEFHRRLDVCQMFIQGMIKGYVNDEIDTLLEEDDPMKEGVELLKLQINEQEGIS